MAEPVDLGKLIRGFRHAQGLTLEELADRSGLGLRTISDLERGRSRNPHARTVAAVADALKVSDAERRTLLETARADRLPSGPAPLCELPPDIPDFSGRAGELAAVVAALAEVRDRAVPVLVTGAPGIGKTVLAVHAAHRTCDQFPDGRLFVDLRGGSFDPLDPFLVQSRLLRALGVAPEDIPGVHPDRGQLLRRMLADRRMLIVLDAAGDEAQVRDLLPGRGGSTALVTSRRSMTGLEHAWRSSLGPLSEAEADAMLRTVIESGGGVACSPPRLREIAELCGNYPLALRVAANRLLSRPTWTLTDQLNDESRKLDRLAAGDLNVRATFDAAYEQLDPLSRLVFRRLALTPGPDADAESAAALTGLSLPEAERHVDDLVERGLLVAVSGHRVHFHELLRLFAQERLTVDDSDDAVGQARARLIS